MDQLDLLNPEQKAAVTHEGGHLLVLAGAGSGKTRVLTQRAAWLIQNNKVKAEEMVLLTFTNKAASEMKERIIQISNEKPWFAGTFHSFGAKVLRNEGRAIGIDPNFVIYDTVDQKEAIADIMKELNLNPEIYAPAVIYDLIEEAKTGHVSPMQFGEYARGDLQQKAFLVYKKYDEYLRESNALDFNDLLIKTVDLLIKRKDAWNERLGHVFVDEWQDTNKIQYQMTQLLLGQRAHITAVGDASQSIYSWRGADFRNVTKLSRDYPTITTLNLSQNYRSSKVIIEAANAVISKNNSHPVLSLWTENDRGQRIKIYKADSGISEAAYIAGKIKELLRVGYSLSEFAILYRANAQSRVIEEALLHAGLPYKLIGGLRFYERAEIKDLLSYMRLIENPKDSVSQLRVEKIGKKRKAAFEKFQEGINKEMATIDLLDGIIAATTYTEKYMRPTEENMAKLENIKELRSVASEFPVLSEFLENVSLISAQEAASSENKESVTMMTIHAAKGLEFGVVFIPGMEEGMFPHSRSIWDSDQLEEERRLAYVALTRAKEILYITYAQSRLLYGQRVSNPPSRFIADIPTELIDTSDNYVDQPRHYYEFD